MKSEFFRSRLVALAVGMTLLASAPALAIVFPVTKVADTNDGACDADCSLREAIIASNAAPGPDQITFAIPASGPHTIVPVTPLPDITSPVTLSGYSQPGSAPNTNVTGGLDAILLIELNGSGAGAGADGLRISAGGSVINGLVINRFSGDGIEIFGLGGNAIQGNFIGVDVTGRVNFGNGSAGVHVRTGDNLIGGGAAPARNLISANANGIVIDVSASGNTVGGNLVGTDLTGTQALGNAQAGLVLDGSSNLVAADLSTPQNLFSGNGGDGIVVRGNANTIRGNVIGTNVALTAPLGNARHGVHVEGSNNAIGIAGGIAIILLGNSISGNGGAGIQVSGGVGNTINANVIGTVVFAGLPTIVLPNAGPGVRLENAVNQTIEGNRIGFNGGAGVELVSGSGNAIRGNQMSDNTGLGIDLFPQGVNPNDPGDSDIGPNNFQNFPVVAAATLSGSVVTIQGALNSSPHTSFDLWFHSNEVCDPAGHGEALLFIGTTQVITDGAGNASFSATFPLLPGISVGQFVTATATDPANNTSEFSRCVAMGAGPVPTPTAGGPGNPVIVPTLTSLSAAILAIAIAAIGLLALRRS